MISGAQLDGRVDAGCVLGVDLVSVNVDLRVADSVAIAGAGLDSWGGGNGRVIGGLRDGDGLCGSCY